MRSSKLRGHVGHKYLISKGSVDGRSSRLLAFGNRMPDIKRLRPGQTIRVRVEKVQDDVFKLTGPILIQRAA